MTRRLGTLLAILAALFFALGTVAVGADAAPKQCPNPSGSHYPANQCTFVLSTNHGPPGSKVKVGGTGWSPSSSVSVFFDNAGHPLGSFPTNSDGTWSGLITIPSNVKPDTSHQIIAHDPTGFQMFRQFTVTETKSKQPTFVVSSNHGPAGSQLFVGGNRWTHNGTVRVFFDNSSHLLGTFSTDSKGAWTGVVTIPSNVKAGTSHQLIAHDATTGTNLFQQFTVTSGSASSTQVEGINFSNLPHTGGPPFGNLPHTGAVVAPLGTAGVALVLGGSSLIAAGRRRRRSSSTTG
jgi:hypothetical protein